MDGLARFLPRGGQLPPEQSDARHRLMTVALALHLPVLLVVGALRGQSLLHLGVELLWLPAALVIVTRTGLRRQVREVVVALALLGCSAVLIHLMDGATEAHFHFFVVLPLLVLYERW
ncbi:hypothetical protein [Egicoccus halophilus]|uniref:Uncharacterized protein n=1 Tax=Egicoccus halophilus TaxID=1670830 RepID=A0A8J3AA55_9ACTN|nr:hypothetical protein [Egicoccus halophilus]GGI06089.1 hypothetical protein GCM10011354_17360 [Egicoccus halophilus]